jgi:diguanylate cyclase (GGDEF)-like protein
MTDRALTLVSTTGLASQFAAAALLALLYTLLRGEVGRRGFFRQWGRAWGALALALGVLVARYELLPLLGLRLTGSQPASHGLLGVYQLGKLLWCLFFLVGTLQYAYGTRRPRLLQPGVPLAIAYAALSAALSATMREILVWQGPVAAAALLYCAVLMLRLPPSRRTLGSRFTGWAFAANGVLWLAFAGSALYSILHADSRGLLFDVLVAGSPFLDQTAGIALGYGMVVVLLEDAKREVDAAHAELSGAHHELRRSALYDPVTGSLNRRAFEEGVGLEHARASFGAVAMMDLDNLKYTNDSQGHGAGDALLRSLADTVRGGLRPSDKLYRWGGDEFLLVMPGAAVPDLRRRLDHLLAESGPPPLQVSIGAADYEGAEGMARAIPEADHAMYEEKKRRKLRPSYLDPSLA